MKKYFSRYNLAKFARKCLRQKQLKNRVLMANININANILDKTDLTYLCHTFFNLIIEEN